MQTVIPEFLRNDIQEMIDNLGSMSVQFYMLNGEGRDYDFKERYPTLASKVDYVDENIKICRDELKNFLDKNHYSPGKLKEIVSMTQFFYQTLKEYYEVDKEKRYNSK